MTGAVTVRATETVTDTLARRLAALCAAAGLSDATINDADRVFREVIAPSSRIEAFANGEGRDWVSEVSDDNTPLEFSVTWSPRGSEVRVLFEPQSEEATVAGHRAIGLQLCDRLADEYGADLGRFRKVEELFTPRDMRGPMALWSAAVFAEGRAPSFKAYLNSQASGAASSSALVEEALARLGMARAWQPFAAMLARRGPRLDELKYFALDLIPGADARAKVYVRHHDATPADLEVAAATTANATPGEAEEFARAMGGGARIFDARAPFTCAAFVSGQDARPASATQYIPVCAYARDDLEVLERICGYMVAHRLDDWPYRRLLAAFANRPLGDGVGMQSWAGFRRHGGIARLSVYLGSELRHVFPAGSIPAATNVGSRNGEAP